MMHLRVFPVGPAVWSLCGVHMLSPVRLYFVHVLFSLLCHSWLASSIDHRHGESLGSVGGCVISVYHAPSLCFSWSWLFRWVV